MASCTFSLLSNEFRQAVTEMSAIKTTGNSRDTPRL